MHVGMFAPDLNVQHVVIPHSAPVHGAFGLVSSDTSYEEQINRPLRVPADPDEVNGIFNDLEGRVRVQLLDDGFEDKGITVNRAVELRYLRQVHVVTTPVEKVGALDEDDLEEVVKHFDMLYEERFGKGSGYREAGVEMINFRVQGTGLIRKPVFRPERGGGAKASDALVETRRAYFGSSRRFLDANCYDFEELACGAEIEGPAIIWTPNTTIVVNPGQTARCDDFRNIHIRW